MTNEWINNWAKRCLIIGKRQQTSFERKTFPVGLPPLLVAKELFYYALQNCLKQGWLSTSVESVSNDNAWTHTMRLFIVSPPDMVSFLEEFSKLPEDKQKVVIEWVKKQRPPAWTAEYNFPDDSQPTFDASFKRMMNANLDLQKQAYNDPNLIVSPETGKTDITHSSDNKLC